MTLDSMENATLLAATEVVPADWRDLTDLLENGGGAAALLRGTHMVAGREAELLAFVRRSIDSARVKHWRQALTTLAIQSPDVDMITVENPRYPSALRAAYGRPPFVFVKGQLDAQDSKAMAIVGSREASPESLAATREIAHEVASSGVTVISGLAPGIDSAAHLAAIEANGRTIAVVASGIDQVDTPTANRLTGRVLKSGAILSQFRPGSPPARSAYLQRNAVISGLSAVSLIMQASERSGTRNEADHALQQGRRVLLWGPSLRHLKWAQLYALNTEVRIVSTVDEVLSEFGIVVGELQGCE